MHLYEESLFLLQYFYKKSSQISARTLSSTNDMHSPAKAVMSVSLFCFQIVFNNKADIFLFFAKNSFHQRIKETDLLKSSIATSTLSLSFISFPSVLVFSGGIYKVSSPSLMLYLVLLLLILLIQVSGQ